MESLHIEEDIYRQIAEYIEDNALPYIRGWHSEADEFRIADVCFETDSAADGYQFVSVTGYGLIHYTRNTLLPVESFPASSTVLGSAGSKYTHTLKKGMK